jgi:hypothetical protein
MKDSNNPPKVGDIVDAKDFWDKQNVCFTHFIGSGMRRGYRDGNFQVYVVGVNVKGMENKYEVTKVEPVDEREYSRASRKVTKMQVQRKFDEIMNVDD